MSADHQPKKSTTANPEFPSDLLARLYREIGISAVAAALQIPEQKADPRVDQRHELLAYLRKDLAA